MTDKRTQASAEQSNMEKDPEDWVTGDEPMTGAQRSYLKTLSEEARQPFDERLTKAQASERIDELQKLTGRGQDAGGRSGAASSAPARDSAAANAPQGGADRGAGRGAGSGRPEGSSGRGPSGQGPGGEPGGEGSAARQADVDNGGRGGPNDPGA